MCPACRLALPILILALTGCPDRDSRDKKPARPPDLTVRLGPGNPLPRTLGRCETGVVMMQLEMEAHIGGDVQVESATFTASGTGDDSADIVGVSLWIDANGDGSLDASDVLLGGPIPYALDDGEVTFPGLARTIPASALERWIVVYDLLSDAAAGRDYEVRLASGGLTAGDARIAGFPVRGPAHSIFGPTLLSALFDDHDANGVIGPGDTLTVLFDREVRLSLWPRADAIFEVVPTGTLGPNFVTPGSVPEEMVVVLQANSVLDPGYSLINVLSGQVDLLDCRDLPVQPLPSPVTIEGELNPRITRVFVGDGNGNCLPDAGDVLEVRFTDGVTLNTSDPAQAFDLLVMGDSLGGGAQFQGGTPVDQETVVVILGASPVLTVGGNFDPQSTSPGSFSGIDVCATPGMIVDGSHPAVSALPGAGIDVSMSATWSATGEVQAGCGFGWKVAHGGDVNGDGFSDIAVAAPEFDTTASPYAGRAYVYHGGNGGLSSSPDWSSSGDDQTMARFGRGLACAGDVNGDGYSDVIVGAPEHDTASSFRGGKAYVYHGGPSGLSVAPAWTSSGDDIPGILFGTGVDSAGDVNGDGFADVIIGAPNQDPGGSPNAGKVYVYHGGASGLSIAPDWTASGDSRASANFGKAVAGAGDIDGDGYGDVIIGAPMQSAVILREGKAFLYRGGPGGLSPTPDWTSSGDGYREGHYGFPLDGAGDVNGDGYDDVAVSAPDQGVASTRFGKIYIYAGSSAGLSTATSWSITPVRDFWRTGHAFSTAGDIDGDGRSDLLVLGRSHAAPVSQDGEIRLILGGPGGPQAVSAWTYRGDGPMVSFSPGSASPAGDVDGDGYPEILLGEPYYMVSGVNSGKASLFCGIR